MKKIITAILLFCSTSYAANEGRGGGDICENKIQNIRDDMQVWIEGGGPQSLDLPEDISVASYSAAMLEQIQSATISCVGEGDPGYPVLVDEVPKVCRFDRTGDSSKITCDYNKFLALSEEDQYILIHHEYAGLAGVEQPNGTQSIYPISNQLSDFLVNKIVKKLSIKRRKVSSSAAEANILILSLQDKVGGKVVSKIELFANDISPNSSSIDDKYRLEVDGKVVEVSYSLLTRLDRSRREYSYDYFTGGIRSFVSGGLCRMGGQPSGSILYVRYLTYDDDSIGIVKHEMLPVYSENRNCLFEEGFAPNKSDAERSAAKAMAELRTIKNLLNE